MYYSAIGLLAVLILLIENQDILLKRNDSFNKPAWQVYRCFLFSVLGYYITDILWGIIEDRKMAGLLFADTTLYFIAMAAGIVFWSLYVVAYLEEKTFFGKLLISTGYTVASMVIILTVVNIFRPVLFTVDRDCVYKALGVRYVALVCQILILLLISVYAFTSMRQHDKKVHRYRTVAFFGLIMALFLTAQIWFPLLPLYSIAYMLGTCLLRAFVIGDEKEEYRNALQEAEKIKEMEQSISALLDNMPALSFSKDAESGVYLACNQAFAEYAHKDDPEGVIGLTDYQIFDEKTADHFAEDDRMALSMDTPYIFFEDVPDATGNQRQFQTTKLKFIDAAGRLCTLGMCQDVTDLVRIQRENATTKEAYEKARDNGIMFNHIAQALNRGYADFYYVNTETGEYIEYHTDNDSGMLTEARRGSDFFESCKKEVNTFVYLEDRDVFLKGMDRDNLLSALDSNKSFFMTYRLITENGPSYVRMKVSRMEDDDRFIVIGVTDVDEEMKQRRAAERAEEEHIAYARINALAGDFLCVYVVVPETGRYREFSVSDGFRSFDIPASGMDFFEVSRENANDVVYPEDVDRFLSVFTRDGVISEIEKHGIFAMTYRLLIGGRPNYVQLKAAMVDEKDGRRLIVGLNDIDVLVRREEEYAKRLAQAQSKASIDALTGVKNKHAYLDEEERLDRLIREELEPDFAIVILDVNDLKKINDTEGHKAGDQVIREACGIICEIFKHSPVFRIGGDEFAVIVKGKDYSVADRLIARMEEHNEEAIRNGGIVIACGMSKFINDGCVAEVFERADISMYENKNSLKAAEKP